MQLVLLIYESPEAFAARNNAGADRDAGAQWAYHRALVEAGVAAGDPLEGPVTGTTVRINDGKRHAQDGSYADRKGQPGGFTIVEVLSLDAALDGAALSYGAVEVRPPSPELRRGVEE